MKLFVWDLHGTLEQGNERAVIDISNNVLERHGYAERFSYTDNPQLYGLKWYEYFAWLFEREDHGRDLMLQEACFKLSAASPDMQYRWIRPTAYAPEVLAKIMPEHHQILISNTRVDTLKVFVDLLGYEEYFSSGNAFAVDGHADRPLSSKEDVLADYLLRSIKYDTIIIIGDSPSDMRLKRVARGIGVTYLYAHPDFAFRKCEADYQIRDLRKVLAHL
jgi:phosphoglycolate phosphatase-like HAD superfamily hydrolase